MLVLAGCAGTVTDATPTDAGATVTNGATETNSITADGSATVSASPDRAVISVAVTATAETAAEARTQVAADVEQLRTALSDAGYEVRTVAFRLSPEYDHSRDERELVGYRAYHALEFETNPDDAGSAVDLAVDNGATIVQNVRFTLSEERRAELREEALAAAVGDARTTAKTVAAAADRSVGSELSIQVGSAGYEPSHSRVVYETAASGTSFEPGPVTVSARVTVTYELE